MQPPRAPRVRLVRCAVALALLAGCTTGDSFSGSTLPPVDPSGTIIIDGESATADSGAEPLIDMGPRAPVVVSESCRLNEPPAAGGLPTVTYVIGASMFELSADANQATCIREMLPTETGPLSWAPTGDRLLIGPNTMLGGFGPLPTGFAPTESGIRWSLPDGAHLVSPSPEDGRVFQREAGNAKTRANVSFLRKTTAVAYHSNGQVMIVGGAFDDANAAVAITDLAGKLGRPIVLLPAAAVVPAISVSATGETIAFIVAGTSNTVRTLRLPELALATRIESTGTLANLVQNGEVLAVRSGDCAGQTTTRLFNGSATIDLNAAAPFVGRSTEPVGFVGDRLIVASRALRCDGPADLWSVDPADPIVPTLLVSGADRAAVRPAPLPPGELPTGIAEKPAQG